MKKGYTIPELVIVIVVLGLISILIINKTSYAFVTDNTSEETVKLILVKSATSYANTFKDELKKEKTKYISASEMIEAGYLIDDNNIYKHYTIELVYDEKTDSILAEVVE